MAMNVAHILRTYQTTDYSDLFDSPKEYHRWLKSIYKKQMQCVYHDPLAHGMSDGLFWNRCRYDEDGEGWRYYGFVDIDPEYSMVMTIEELRDWFEENMAVRICSDYDCTGKPFTSSIHFNVNPTGMVSFVHHMARDI